MELVDIPHSKRGAARRVGSSPTEGTMVKRKCKNCERIISEKKDYRNLFCSRSCSTSFNNLNRKNTLQTISIKREKSIEWCILNGMNIIHRKECKFCKEEFEYEKSYKSRKTYCSTECRRVDRQRHLNELEKYRARCKFKFNVFKYPAEFDLMLYNKHGFYKPTNKGNNLLGISRDHMYSIMDGYKNGIDSKLISHPANCRLILQTENSRKHSKSIIDFKILMDRIKEWNNKYGAIV